MIVKGLEADPQVSFDTEREKCKDDAEYADAVWKEFRAFGFASGEYTALLLRVLQISGMSREKIEAAREDFTSEG